MNKSFRDHPKYKIFIWLAFFVCLMSIYILVAKNRSTLVPYGDTVSYWATGRLLLRGENPYSAEEVLKIQGEIGELQTSPLDEISMNLYPPWATTFALPLGFFSYPITRIIWLLFNTVIILISAKITWFLYSGPSSKLIIPYLVTIFFFPTMLLLGVGHNSALSLLGLCGFLYFIKESNKSQYSYFLAGASAALTTIRPQLLYLFLIGLVFWVFKYRIWSILLGGITAIFILTLIPMVLDPQIVIHYLATFLNYQYGTWATPTIGTILRLLFGAEKSWLQILPSLVGFGWFIYFWYKKQDNWNWLNDISILIFVSVITSAYVWTYDMVILLIPIISVFAVIAKTRFNWVAWTYFLSFFLLNAITFYLHTFIYDYFFIWFAPLLLGWYLVGLNIYQRSNSSRRKLTVKVSTQGE